MKASDLSATEMHLDKIRPMNGPFVSGMLLRPKRYTGIKQWYTIIATYR